MLIRCMDSLDVHRLVVRKQRFAEILSRIRDAMDIEQLFRCDVREIQIIDDTETFPVIETEDMFARLISVPLE